jgi:uncharacterized C2H2 Zn-finger protein
VTQLTLPVQEIKGRCGYCERRLVAVKRDLPGYPTPMTLYECERCAPLLRQIETPEQYRRFVNRAMGALRER